MQEATRPPGLIRPGPGLRKAANNPGMIKITESITLDEQEIHEDFVRASGPGGQNINRVATAVKLRFDAAGSPSLPHDVRERLIQLAGKRLTEEGVLIIDARRFRTQERNRQDARDRLVALVRKAAQKPRPRRKTHPPKAAKTRRLEEKRHRGQIKQKRRPPQIPDGERQ